MATRILVFAGSTRSGALSAKLAALAAKELALADADGDADLARRLSAAGLRWRP